MSRPVIALLCATLTTGCALKVGVGVAAAIDVHSTRVAQSRGAHEINPLLGQELAQQVAVKTVAVSSLLALTTYVERQGHPTLARALQVLAITASLVAARYNYTFGPG